MLTTMLLVANTAPLNKMSLDHGSVSCCTVTICICGALYAPDIPSFRNSIGVKSRVQSYRHAKTNAVAGQETAPARSVAPDFVTLGILAAHARIAVARRIRRKMGGVCVSLLCDPRRL